MLYKYFIAFLFFCSSIIFQTITSPTIEAKENSSKLLNFSDRTCTLTGHEGESAQVILTLENQYDCGPNRISKNTNYLWFIADIEDLQTHLKEPVLRFRSARHGAVTIYRIFDNGAIVMQKFEIDDLDDNWRSAYAIGVELVDDQRRKPVQIIIGVKDPWDPQNWFDLEILEKEDDIRLDQQSREISALITGILLAPLLLNLVFYATIQKRFIVFHTIMTFAVFINHVSWTGQIFNIFSSATTVDRSTISHIALSVVAFGGLMLIRSMCDPQKLGNVARSALLIASSSCVIITICVMIFASSLALLGSQIFHISIAITVLIGIISLIYASLRGDKIAMLQLLGMTPAMIIGMLRISRALGWVDYVPILDLGFNFAVLTEVLVTSMIVASLATNLRKDHDAAIKESEMLGNLASTDHLTQILNRRGFMERYNNSAVQSGKHSTQRTLMILDIDNFKQINDKFGHDAGDMVLIQIAEVIKRACRTNDIYARHGGEEFILMTSSHQSGAIDAFANQLLKSIANHQFKDEKRILGQITVSIGIIPMDIEQAYDFNIYYRAADQALYAAKNAGRNQIAYGKLPSIKNEVSNPRNDNKKGGNTPIPTL